MEDTHKRIDNFQEPTNSRIAAFYAVYDGHGGDQAARILEKKFHTKIHRTEYFNGEIESALKNGFKEMDEEILKDNSASNAGATCVCCVFVDEKIYFANVGDAEGLLISVGPEEGTSGGISVTPRIMSTLHKADDPVEQTRVEKLGGRVFMGRVCGSLAVARAFGDSKYKTPRVKADYVSAEPALHVTTLQRADKYAVLACDGLFDVMNHQEVAEMVHQNFLEGLDAPGVARELATHAVENLGTGDNVTVVVVKLEWN